MLRALALRRASLPGHGLPFLPKVPRSRPVALAATQLRTRGMSTSHRHNQGSTDSLAAAQQKHVSESSTSVAKPSGSSSQALTQKKKSPFALARFRSHPDVPKGSEETGLLVYLLVAAGLVTSLLLWFGLARNEGSRQMAFQEAVSSLRKKRRVAKQHLREMCGEGRTLTLGPRVDLQVYTSGTGPCTVLLIPPEEETSTVWGTVHKLLAPANCRVVSFHRKVYDGRNERSSMLLSDDIQRVLTFIGGKDPVIVVAAEDAVMGTMEMMALEPNSRVKNIVAVQPRTATYPEIGRWKLVAQQRSRSPPVPGLMDWEFLEPDLMDGLNEALHDEDNPLTAEDVQRMKPKTGGALTDEQVVNRHLLRTLEWDRPYMAEWVSKLVAKNIERVPRPLKIVDFDFNDWNCQMPGTPLFSVPVMQVTALLSLIPLFGYDISQTARFNFIDEGLRPQLLLKCLDAFGIVFPYTYTQGGARLWAVFSQLSSSDVKLRYYKTNGQLSSMAPNAKALETTDFKGGIQWLLDQGKGRQVPISFSLQCPEPLVAEIRESVQSLQQQLADTRTAQAATTEEKQHVSDKCE